LLENAFYTQGVLTTALYKPGSDFDKAAAAVMIALDIYIKNEII